jgi:hypothetical protein
LVRLNHSQDGDLAGARVYSGSMRALFIGAVIVMALMPEAMFAQGGQRRAPPPNRSQGQFRSAPPMTRSPGRTVRRPGNSPRATGGAVFRARPWTYRPGRSQLFFPGGGGYYPYPYYPFPYYPSYSYPYSYPYPYSPTGQIQQDAEPTVIVFPSTPDEVAPAAPPAPAPPPEPYVAGPLGPPKTFYVIPGCYLGDRRPDPGSLAPRCSISQLRVIPPSP